MCEKEKENKIEGVCVCTFVRVCVCMQDGVLKREGVSECVCVSSFV